MTEVEAFVGRGMVRDKGCVCQEEEGRKERSRLRRPSYWLVVSRIGDCYEYKVEINVFQE